MATHWLPTSRGLLFSVLLTLTSISCTQPVLDAGQPLTAADLHGEWQVVASMRAGRELSRQTCLDARMLFEFRDREYTQFVRDECTATGTWSIDTSTSPAEIDLHTKGQPVQRGIVRLNGNTLEWCLAEPGEKRPRHFRSVEGTNDECSRLIRMQRSETRVHSGSQDTLDRGGRLDSRETLIQSLEFHGQARVIDA